MILFYSLNYFILTFIYLKNIVIIVFGLYIVNKILDYTKKVLYISLIAIYFLLFFKTAWVCDDAYINFRSIDQLYAGNGPVWNPHERVQVYTSPLWYWLHASVAWIFNDYFLCTISISFILFCFFSIKLSRFAETPFNISILILFALASRSFYDFASSGLETMLCSFITLLTSINYFKYCNAIDNSEENLIFYKKTLFCFSIVPLCRHDLITLLIIPVSYMVYCNSKYSNKEKLTHILLVLMPIVFWSIFSVIYYGMPFPNTAYAKLYTGISKLNLINQGLGYIKACLIFEPIIVVSFFFFTILGFIKGNRYARAFACGILLNIFYVVLVGGDFMAGRFLLSAIIVSAIFMINIKLFEKIKAKSKIAFNIFVIFLLFYIFFFKYNSFNIPTNLYEYNIPKSGIVDERLFYNQISSIFKWIENRNIYLSEEDYRPIFPEYKVTLSAYIFSKEKPNIYYANYIGFYGFWIGLNNIVIDVLALADPFLARHETINKENFRIGHFIRNIPQDYIESIKKHKNCFRDPKEANLYNLIYLATQSKDLFTIERFKAILDLATFNY